MTKYILFIIFKTVLTVPFVLAAINGFINSVKDDLYIGWIITIPISIFLLYDWIRSMTIPFWKDNSKIFPVYWEGGGLN